MVPVAAFSDRRLTYRQLVVFGVLCSFRSHSSDLSVCQGRESIAERCKFHPSVISATTTELEKLGWIRKEGRGGRSSGGGSRRTCYTITEPQIVSYYATVAECVTVATSATVADHVTVTDSVSPTVADYATPHIEEKKLLENCTSSKSKNPPVGFTEFWNVYPRKVAKVRAESAWRSLKLSEQMIVLVMVGLERQKETEQWNTDKGRFIPHPATWLSQKRWEDELPQESADCAKPAWMKGAL